MNNFFELINSKSNVVEKNIGLQYPITTNNGYFDQTKTTFDEKRNSIHHMLNTYKGEIPMLPEFGCRFRELVFDIIDEEKMTNFIRKDINNQLELWHNDTTLSNITFSYTNNDNNLSIYLEFEVTASENYNISFDLIFNI